MTHSIEAIADCFDTLLHVVDVLADSVELKFSERDILQRELQWIHDRLKSQSPAPSVPVSNYHATGSDVEIPKPQFIKWAEAQERTRILSLLSQPDVVEAVADAIQKALAGGDSYMPEAQAALSAIRSKIEGNG